MNYRAKIKWHYHEVLKRFYPFLWSKHLSKELLGKTTDFSAPMDLNEKIQWLMFYTDTTLWSLLADKYAVRQYVSERVGSKYLIPLLGKWDSVSEINFQNLPEKFVIKPNNGSYDTIVCKNKTNLNIEAVKSQLEYSLNHKFGYEHAEIHYTKIHPCIIAEELLESNEPGGLKDYKIWCFNGKPHCVFVCANRDNLHHTADFVCYDLNWTILDGYITSEFLSPFQCPRPKNLEKLLEIASVLSQNLPQARVDLYNVNGKIYFGEMTMSSNFGMMPYFTPEALQTMGHLVILPQRTLKERLRAIMKRWLPNI